ncbi:MAG: hypothetical protein QOF62_1462 [Pyrinomonadaceae bacterium]|jgi:hypothetical protein|nr:hypothetical protein [Pyrinomonadaceae bacterium]
MRKPKRKAIAGLVLVGVAMTGMVLARVIKARSVTNLERTMTQNQEKKALNVEPAAVDVVDKATGPTDSRERAKRDAKNRRYDKKDKRAKRLTGLPSGGGVVRGGEAPPPLPLPAAQSDAVIIATVIRAQPYLTASETSMYTEFTFSVEEVLKNDGLASVAVGNTVDADREAGAMRLPDGRVIRYETGGVGRLPRVGRQYVLFLTRCNDGQDLSVLTGYELHQGRVFSLDGEKRVFSPETGLITRKAPFEGVEKATFLELVRTAIANPNRVLMPEGRNSQ